MSPASGGCASVAHKVPAVVVTDWEGLDCQDSAGTSRCHRSHESRFLDSLVCHPPTATSRPGEVGSGSPCEASRGALCPSWPRPGTVIPITQTGGHGPGAPPCFPQGAAKTTCQRPRDAPRALGSLPVPTHARTPSTHVQLGGGWRRTPSLARLPARSGRNPTTWSVWGRQPRGRGRSGGVPACGRWDAAARWHTKEAAGRRGGAGRGRGRQEGAGAGRAAIKPPPPRPPSLRCGTAGLLGLRGECRRRRLFASPTCLAAAAALRPPTLRPTATRLRLRFRLRLGPLSAAATWGSRARGGEYGLRAPRPIAGARGREGRGRRAPCAGHGPGALRAARSATLRPARRLRGVRGERGPGAATSRRRNFLSLPRAASAETACAPGSVPGPRGAGGGPGPGEEGPRRLWRPGVPAAGDSPGAGVVCAGASSLAPVTLNLRYPGTRQASSTLYFACALPVGERQTDSVVTAARSGLG